MSNNKGFTLVELMVALAISGIIIAAVYSVYTLQQKTYTAQDQVVEMQQNIRVATLSMVQEIRIAGLDPQGKGKAVIKDAHSDAIYFTADLNSDGNVSIDNDDIGEHIAFDLYTNAEGISMLGMTREKKPVTITDMGSGHYEATGHQPIAENIEAIEFQYRDDNDNVTTTLSDIRTVTISILARAAWQDPKFVNDTIYKSASGKEWNITAPNTPTNDNYRRRLLITTVQCRNMGL